MPKYLKINQNVFSSQHWQKGDRESGMLIDSEIFPLDLRYVVKKNALMLMGLGNGVFAFDLSAGQLLAKEIYDISEVWQQQKRKPFGSQRLGAAGLFSELQWEK